MTMKTNTTESPRRRSARNLYLDSALIHKVGELVEAGEEKSLSLLVERLLNDHLSSARGKKKKPKAEKVD